MLQIKKVNKYYNRHRKNQIHVINNTTLTMDKTGLVALLGPSGCGKTTILNTIGGLDKINKGQIYINGQKISSRFPHKVDKIRNLNIGYIFQDYKLIDNMSVYDNIKLVLKLIGLKDKTEIDKRITYVLDKVGMLRYKNRPASMLSGGERQRVGIARAIAKDPDIILADEPTGNLDSKNSLEIMKIIRAISKEKLVILVTHEQNLAKFYASRIIKLEDGKVIEDYPNDNDDILDYEIENTFYLKDMHKETPTDEVTIYKNNDEATQKINIDIVVRGANIYIRSNTPQKPVIVDQDSTIELIDDHYKAQSKKDIDKYNFDFSNIVNNNYKKKYSSILNPITLIIEGFKKVINYSFLKKILLAGFFLSGIFIMYASSSIAKVLTINDEDFITINKNYLIVESKKNDLNTYLENEQTPEVNYIIPSNSIVKFTVDYKEYYQTSTTKDTLSASISDTSMITKDNLISGRLPENSNEVVVDIMSINKMFKEQSYAKMAGITTAQSMIGREIKLQGLLTYTIVGLTDLKSPSIYMSKDNFTNVLSLSDYDTDLKLLSYDIISPKVTLKEGRIPTNDYEAIININQKEDYKIGKKLDTKVAGTPLTVVGYYDSPDNYDYILTNENTIKYNNITTLSNYVIYTSNKENTVKAFHAKNLNIKDSYESSKEAYKKEMSSHTKNVIIASLITLIISLIEIFLMTRASFLSRIKEIGILRAVGVKRSDIYKMFIGEIIATTTLGCLPGIALMYYILTKLQTIPYLKSMILASPLVLLIAIISIYIFNIIVGLIPVFNTVRKTPASILSRHDLD